MGICGVEERSKGRQFGSSSASLLNQSEVEETPFEAKQGSGTVRSGGILEAFPAVVVGLLNYLPIGLAFGQYSGIPFGPERGSGTVKREAGWLAGWWLGGGWLAGWWLASAASQSGWLAGLGWLPRYGCGIDSGTRVEPL